MFETMKIAYSAWKNHMKMMWGVHKGTHAMIHCNDGMTYIIEYTV